MFIFSLHCTDNGISIQYYSIFLCLILFSLNLARKDRAVLYEQREHEFENAKTLEQWLLTREKMKLELGIELRGDLTIEDEKFLRQQIQQRSEKLTEINKEIEKSNEELQKLDKSFTRLKEVTGVKNVEEMHEKFFNQRTNKFQLVEKDVPEMKKRLEEAKNSYLKVENDFKMLKSSGVGLEEINRNSIEALEKLAYDARIDQKAINADAERIATVLLGLHQGSAGLLQRVHPYQYLIDANVFELTQVGEEISPWTETVDALNTAEHILSKMLEVTQGENNANTSNNSDEEEEEDDDDNKSQFSQDSDNFENALEAPDPNCNVRVKSKLFMKQFESTNDALDNELIPGNNNNNNTNITNVGGGGGGGAGGGVGVSSSSNLNANGDSAVNAVAVAVGGGVGGGGVGNSGGGGDAGLISEKDFLEKDGNYHHLLPNNALLNLVTPDEDPNKSRVNYKLAAEKQKTAFDKQEKRRKKVLERLETSNNKDDAAKASMRAQRDRAAKLCTIKKVPTLPDGVTLRDDPMTKTIAFLNADPDLV
jgi:hypothetical protein